MYTLLSVPNVTSQCADVIEFCPILDLVLLKEPKGFPWWTFQMVIDAGVYYILYKKLQMEDFYRVYLL